MMGLICSMVPAMAVILPMRPPFCRYSRVSTQKKTVVLAMRRGIRAQISFQVRPSSTKRAASNTVRPVPKLPLRVSKAATSSPGNPSPISLTAW